jgi:integrase
MPITLYKRKDTPYYWARGSYLGVSLCRSTKTDKRSVAVKIVKQWESEIERSCFTPQGRKTFLEAAVSYLQAGGEKWTVGKLIERFKDTYLDEIDQAAIDQAAAEIPGSPATKNRKIYTPLSAILKHAGADFRIKRPSGSGGRQIADWLRPEDAGKLFRAAKEIDAEFSSLLVFLCYTGCRLSEALNLQCADVDLSNGEAFVRKTKNGHPRRVYLPAAVIAELASHPRGLERSGKVFRWTKCGRIYALHRETARRAGVTLPQRSSFHLYRHTYATWMRRYADADAKTLVATGAWISEKSASRYLEGVRGSIPLPPTMDFKSFGHFPVNREIYREFPSGASEGWLDDSSKAGPFELIRKNFPTT